VLLSQNARSLTIALTIGLACIQLGEGVPLSPGPRFYRAEELNSGPERYSAWFADGQGSILYFGLSPFWTHWWRTGGDPRTDLREPGDHLIGRFDLAGERFLPPLLVRAAGPKSRSSVWDVLAHSNGRIYYTTYFEEIGWVSPDGGEVRHFENLGLGFNELVEGPGGLLYVTRYSDDPFDVGRQRFGSLVVLSPDGELVREFEFPLEEGRFTAPKSVAVDPVTGEIWLNADVFAADGSVSYAWFRLSADGDILEQGAGSPELHFVWFDPEGIGWFAEEDEGDLWLRAKRAGTELVSFPLGPRRGLDFVQDIKAFGSQRVLAALWSGRAFVASLAGPSLAEIRFQRPADCAPPDGRSLVYTAVGYRNRVCATIVCGAAVLCASLPPEKPSR
jgi:hypothetical protein